MTAYMNLEFGYNVVMVQRLWWILVGTASSLYSFIGILLTSYNDHTSESFQEDIIFAIF